MSEHADKINDALTKVMAKVYAKAQTDLNDVLDAKLADRLDQERVAIASRIYGEEESSETSETEVDTIGEE